MSEPDLTGAYQPALPLSPGERFAPGTPLAGRYRVVAPRKVRLTDFGLAAAAEDLSVSEVRSGTPLYQGPEQLAGWEVTVRSDLFALGLVLYELFTGKRAFADQRRDTPPSKPTSHVANLSPPVEALILKCLEPDPAARPRSAAAVLAAFPGGDPLAAALAAGQTPSPQLVADAGGSGRLSPRAATAYLLATIAGLVGLIVLAGEVRLISRVPLPRSPEYLEGRAHDVLAELGYRDPPRHRPRVRL